MPYVFLLETYKGRRCNITGGVVHINWHPQRSCFGEDTIEQARFCFPKESSCHPVCEASFFANGTFRGARTYARTYNEINESCVKSSFGCSFQPNRGKDVKFISVSWSPKTRTITCALFRTCVENLGPFSIKVFSMNSGREVFRKTDVCHPDSMIDQLSEF